MSDYTPGPWQAGRQHGTSVWQQALPEGATLIVSMGTQWALGVDVAAVPATGAPGDAALICAAPDLLEACISAAFVIQDRETESLREEILAKLRGAIAKAEGKR